MNNEYTPTLEEIREVWGDRSVSREGRSTTQWRELTVAAIAEFDRAIAKIRAEANQEALRESCRECKDTLPFMAPAVRADFILWGKFFPPEAFGPKCYDHAEKHLGNAAMSRIDQYAVFDLRADKLEEQA